MDISRHVRHMMTHDDKRNPKHVIPFADSETVVEPADGLHAEVCILLTRSKKFWYNAEGSCSGCLRSAERALLCALP